MARNGIVNRDTDKAKAKYSTFEIEELRNSFFHANGTLRRQAYIAGEAL
jgi:hypothetical protein